MTTRDVGNWGEQIAHRFCDKKGWRVLERNWRAGRHEIDLIAQDKHTIVFIEVKTRTTDLYGLPEESINPAKISSLRKAVASYIAQKRIRKYRVDVISIQQNQGSPTLRHIPDIDLSIQTGIQRG